MSSWSVFKVSLLFFTLVGVMLLVAGIVLWNVISAFGWVTKVESLTGSLVGGSFKLRSGQLLRAGLLLDILFVLLMVFMSTLLTALYNLIADVTGGVTYVAEERSAVAKPGLLQNGIARIRRINLSRPAAKGDGGARKTGTATARRRLPAKPAAPKAGNAQKPAQKVAQKAAQKVAQESNPAKSGQKARQERGEHKPAPGGAGQEAAASPVAAPTKAAPSP